MSSPDEPPRPHEDERSLAVVANDAESNKPLKPARPDPEELDVRPAYMPRIPWRSLAMFGGLVALMVIGYSWREQTRTDATRAQLLDTYQRHLSELSDRYIVFRDRIDRWVMEAGRAGEPERWVDPRLHISGLHSGEGLYMRLNVAQTTDPEQIEVGALLMEADALTRCLGLAPASARGLYHQGYFLTREWLEEARGTSDLMKLRVLEEQLARSIEVDVPVIATLLRSDYFLLAIQQGESRRDAPVDIYLWDLNEERLLLRARTEANGMLLPVRLQFDGARRGNHPPPQIFSPGAADCSIAAQIKAMTGEPAMEFASEVPSASRREASESVGSEASESVGSEASESEASEPGASD